MRTLHYLRQSTAMGFVVLLLTGCSVLGGIHYLSAWRGHPIEDFIAKQGQPSSRSKQTFGKGNEYVWSACWNTGRVVTYQENAYGPYYTQAETVCTSCSAYTDENNIITGFYGRCP